MHLAHYIKDQIEAITPNSHSNKFQDRKIKHCLNQYDKFNNQFDNFKSDGSLDENFSLNENREKREEY